MPITVTAPQGVLTPRGEAEVLPQLTAALIESLGAAGNAFVEEIVGGTVHILDRRHVYAGGRPSPVVMVEVKLPNVGLTDIESRAKFITLATEIVHDLTVDSHVAFHTWINILNAPDGGWGFGGTAWTNQKLAEAIEAGESTLAASV